MKKLLLLPLLFLLSFKSDIQDSIKVQKSWYTIHFSTSRKVPLWTEYTFTSKNFSEVAPRSANLKKDDKIPANKQSGNDDYIKNYDRGHLVPDHDMRFSTDAEKECMTYANVAPQWHTLNQGPWKSIENYVRELGVSFNSINVWTGVLFDDNKTKIIGNGVHVPTYFWKAIQLKLNDKEINTIAFLCSNSDPKDNNIGAYAISVDSLEKLTSLNIFDNDGYEANIRLIVTEKQRKELKQN